MGSGGADCSALGRPQEAQRLGPPRAAGRTSRSATWY